MFCPKCGKELPDDSQFCMKCGHAIPVRSYLNLLRASSTFCLLTVPLVAPAPAVVAKSSSGNKWPWKF